MDSVTIDGMDEHEFRHSIEDLLRSGEADEAATKLRGLLEPYAAAGGVLPPRFLDVGASNLEFAGWNKLASRLLDHDRRGYPISAIGVVLADARALGGPRPAGGWLAPFVKTFYFSDEAYPFTGAARDDLLDGYSRDGFGWQGDYQATDATLSIKGIDDLHGAIVALEDRLLDCRDPDPEEIRAGTIGACYLAVLIHQALRETIRGKGLPRPLCVLAACDGVYPFFDAPVAGQDEYMAPATANARATEELEEAVADEEELLEELAMEGSLLSIASPRGAKSPVMLVSEEECEEAARFTEMAGAQRMVIADEHELKGLLHGTSVAPGHEAAVFDRLPQAPEDPALAADLEAITCFDSASADEWSHERELLEAVDDQRPEGSEEESNFTHAEAALSRGEDVVPALTPARHSLRARIRTEQPSSQASGRDWQSVMATWLKSFLGRIVVRQLAVLSR